MIVVCNACHAKFRIADDKVGPRGIRVRCSKCQNVFAIKRAKPDEEPAPPPPPPPSLELVPQGAPSSGGSAASLDLDLDDAGRSGGEGPAPPTPPPPDPFAPAADTFFPSAADPFAPAAPSPQPPDPFAQPMAAASASALAGDPFADAGLSAASAAAPPPFDDPFAMPGAPPDGAAAEAPVPPQVPPDPGLVAAPRARVGAVLPPPLPKPAAAAPAPGPLALEEGTPRGEPLGAEHFDLESTGGGVPALASSEPAPSQPSAAEPRPAVAERPLALEPPPEVPVADEERPAAPRAESDGRLRSLFVNSMSLAVLLALALGLFMFWREPKVLPGARLVGKAGRSPAAAATQVSSGLYRAFDGRLLLFVRGRIRVEASSAVGAVTVRADLVKGEAVVASAESTAGAVPSPEELASVAGREDAEQLRLRLARRAPKQVRPGELLPFLVVFTEYPGDLGQITIHVATEVAAAGPG